MSELLDFAARVIEAEGGLVEAKGEVLCALLPPLLASAWQAAEELVVSETESARSRLAYGSELLERMLETATADLPIVSVRADAPPVRGGQVRAAAERWCLRNGVASVDDVRFGPQTRLWIDAIATLQGDEKREILFSTVLSPTTCTDVPGFEAAAGGLLPVTGGALPISDQTLERMVGICSERAVELAAGFRASMTRRFERDRERIESYFRELTDELDRRVARGKVDASAALDKRAALRGDRAAKLEALAARFVLRIETSPVALRIVQVDGAFATLSLRRRKSARRLELEFDAVTKRIVPPACENCHRAALKPAACDDAMHLLCERCIPRAEGRIACPACHKDHAGCARRAGEAQPSHAG